MEFQSPIVPGSCDPASTSSQGLKWNILNILVMVTFNQIIGNDSEGSGDQSEREGIQITFF
jgi:hypothetical protein